MVPAGGPFNESLEGQILKNKCVLNEEYSQAMLLKRNLLY